MGVNLGLLPQETNINWGKQETELRHEDPYSLLSIIKVVKAK